MKSYVFHIRPNACRMGGGRGDRMRVSGNLLTLKLKEPISARNVTYLKEAAWSQKDLIRGANGIAALTSCEVPLEER